MNRVAILLLSAIALARPLSAEPLEQTTSAGPPRQPKLITGRIQLDANRVSLSGSLALTITVTGPSPLRIALPDPLVNEQSQQDWLSEVLDAPQVRPLREGRERWQARLRLEPFVAGKQTIRLAPLSVQTLEQLEPFVLRWPDFSVLVTTQVRNPSLELLQPNTDIERLPSLPADAPFPWWAWALISVGFLVLLALAWAWRRPRRPPHTLTDWLCQELRHNLQQFDQTKQPAVAYLDRLAHLLRTTCVRVWQLPAEQRTTQELLRDLRQLGSCKESQVAELELLLTTCDQARFAGQPVEHARALAVGLAVTTWLAELVATRENGEFGKK